MRVEDPGLDAPLENLPRLYQLWATLHVIEVAVQVATSLGFIVTHQELVARDADGLFIKILRDGRSAIRLRHTPSGTRVTITPEKSYTPNGSPISSISYTQRPDVVVDIRSTNGRRQLLIFDPKYKLQSEFITASSDELDEALEFADEHTEGTSGRPKKVDIDKMHAYRDAIQLDHLRVVDYAAILYPGPQVDYGTEVAALPAYPTRTDELDDSLHAVLDSRLAEAIRSQTDR